MMAEAGVGENGCATSRAIGAQQVCCSIDRSRGLAAVVPGVAVDAHGVSAGTRVVVAP
jgi:hypothetical protein